tara:strand:- start:46 stop:396 length:351 start_codon:yes stop_codon:yes gene_type:complete
MDDSSTHSRSRNVMLSTVAFALAIGTYILYPNSNPLVGEVRRKAMGDDNYFSPEEQEQFLDNMGYKGPFVEGRDRVRIGAIKGKPYVIINGGKRGRRHLPESLVNEEALRKYLRKS